ncbi:MAG: CobW family GTP-binding protein [Pseudomonadota bacterium]
MLHDIPLNLVTGFLGAGKTTLIRHLLATRPPGARWAVLVNEFGDTGIDGALLGGTAAARDDGITVREVPGGCLCCANGLPFRVALNALLKQARPERVLVEPTGLGHPLQLLAQLAAPEYREVLELRATLCVIDPVAAADPRVRDSDIFAQQLASADLLVLNHADRSGAAELAALDTLLADHGLSAVPRVSAVRGAIDPALLDAPRRRRDWQLLPPPAGHDMTHDGAVWPAAVRFPHDDILTLLLALPVQRLKAVLHTERGWLEINATPQLSEWRAREPAADNRVEVIVDAGAGLPPLQSVLATLLAPDSR